MTAQTPVEQQAYAEWNRGLEAIEPLIDYYTRQMGQLSGRLMAALSFLDDLKNSRAWPDQAAQVRETVNYASLLIASVLKMVAAAQAEENDLEQEAAAAIREVLDLLGHNKPDSLDF